MGLRFVFLHQTYPLLTLLLKQIVTPLALKLMKQLIKLQIARWKEFWGILIKNLCLATLIMILDHQFLQLIKPK